MIPARLHPGDFRWRPALHAVLLMRAVLDAHGDDPPTVAEAMRECAKMLARRCPVLEVLGQPREHRREYVRVVWSPTRRRLQELVRAMMQPAPDVAFWPRDALAHDPGQQHLGPSPWERTTAARRCYDLGRDPRTRPDVMPPGRHGMAGWRDRVWAVRSQHPGYVGRY